MISIVFGVPGSGKTYYSVFWLKRRALEEGDVFFRVRPDVLLITNLKLNLDSMDNYIYIEEWEAWKKYMDVDFWRSNLPYIQGKKIIMVMDEAQVFFQNYKDDARVLFFLQYHRHLSVEILLITQTLKSMPQKVIELSEYIIEAVPKSINPFSRFGFRYRVLHPFDRSIVLRRFHLGFDHTLFYLYSDMIYKMDEDRPQNAFRRPFLVLASFLILFAFAFFSLFSTIFSRAKSSSYTQIQTTQTQTKTQSPGGQILPVQFDYEDLITEEKPRLGEGPIPQEKPKSEENPQGGRPIPLPSGSYRIVAGKPSADSPKNQEEEDPLELEPKIIYLP